VAAAVVVRAVRRVEIRAAMGRLFRARETNMTTKVTTARQAEVRKRADVMREQSFRVERTELMSFGRETEVLCQ
jgi:hypothetical protein